MASVGDPEKHTYTEEPIDPFAPGNQARPYRDAVTEEQRALLTTRFPNSASTAQLSSEEVAFLEEEARKPKKAAVPKPEVSAEAIVQPTGDLTIEVLPPEKSPK